MKSKTTMIALFLLIALIPISAQDIFKAISSGDLNQVKSMISKNPELINAKNKKMGLTAVEMAFMMEMQKSKLEIAPYLIDNGAEFDVNKKNRFGYTPLDMAIVYGAIDAAEYLIKLKPEIDSVRQRDGKTPLINAITRGRMRIADFLITNGADINVASREGYPAIYYGVKKGYTGLIKLMADKNVSMNFIDDNERTLLHIASLTGFYEIAKILLTQKQNIDATDKYKRKPLYYASKYGHRKVADLLIDNGAEKNLASVNNFNESPFSSSELLKGDAIVWYMNNRGWAVKTKNHMMIFDSEEFGVTRPSEPSLANGFLTASELEDENIIALYTAYHGEIGEPAYIHTLEDSVANITYVHNKLDQWRGSEKTIYMEPREEITIGDVQIISISIQENMPVLGYLCRVDDILIYYSGFRAENIDVYKKEINFLTQFAEEIDLAFLPIAEPGEQNNEVLYIIEKLHPKSIFPLDPDRREYLFPQMKNLINKQNQVVEILCAENPGDNFYFNKSQKKEEKTTISMNLDMMVPNIEVFINGKGPYRFELDTGAGTSIITNQLANELNLAVIKQDSVHSPDSDIPIIVEVVNIQNLSISDIEIEDLRMIKMDLGIPFTDGILSIKHFYEYLITIDYPKKTIDFAKGNLNNKFENVVNFSKPHGAMSVPIEINGKKKEAFLDSGYPGSFSFPYSSNDELSFLSPLVEAGQVGYVGGFYKFWKTKLDGVIKIGEIVYVAPEINLEDRNADFINIGFEAIKDFALTIDQKNSLIKFEKQFMDNSIPDIKGEDSEFAGRYGGVRSITYENGDLFLQRDGRMKLKLESIDGDLYNMVLPDAMVSANKLPKIRFDRNEKNEIYRITFVHEEGREEYALKD